VRYLMLIINDETAKAVATPETRELHMAEYTAFNQEMGERGVLQGTVRLHPTTQAKTVRVRDGEVVAADGPFASANEQIAGYFVVDCADLDEALEIAAKNPGARYGTIEVRPIWDM